MVPRLAVYAVLGFEGSANMLDAVKVDLHIRTGYLTPTTLRFVLKKTGLSVLSSRIHSYELWSFIVYAWSLTNLFGNSCNIHVSCAVLASARMRLRT
jgi:hypothetical protein